MDSVGIPMHPDITIPKAFYTMFSCKYRAVFLFEQVLHWKEYLYSLFIMSGLCNGKFISKLFPVFALGIFLILFIAFCTLSKSGHGESFVFSKIGPVLEAIYNAVNCQIFGMPIVIMFVAVSCVYFTFRLKFVNVRLFSHGLKIFSGKYEQKDESSKNMGYITPRNALMTAIAGEVGLGNIAGVAIAIQIGGPGALLWMIISSFFIMTVKFAEVALGHKYRDKGYFVGGPFYYIKTGLSEKNMPSVGNVLAMIFAFCYLITSLGGGTVFQANQAISMLTNDNLLQIPVDKIAISVIFTVLVAVVIIGGVERISRVSSKIVPFMSVTYFFFRYSRAF